MKSKFFLSLFSFFFLIQTQYVVRPFNWFRSNIGRLKPLTTVKLFIAFVLVIYLAPQKVYPYAGSHKGILTCSDCHTAYPMGISSAEGNINLCLSCHTGGAMASNLALYSVDQATITPGLTGGVYGKSHRWDALAYQVDIATDPQPTILVDRDPDPGRELLAKVKIFNYAKSFKDKTGNIRIACSSCHNMKTERFIRNEQERDEKLCVDCHTYDHQLSTTSAREFTSGKKQNHPTKTVGGSYVGCSSCHIIHGR